MSHAETVTVTLKKPITHNDVEYKELTFREAKVGDLMASDHFAGEFSKLIAVLASISDTPLPVFKEIGAPEIKTIISQTKHLVGND